MSSEPGRSIQVSSLNSFWGLKSSLRPAEPKTMNASDRQQQVAAEADEEDLPGLAHELGVFLSVRAQDQGRGQVDRERDEREQRRHQAVFPFSGEADHEDGDSEDPGAPHQHARS